MTERRLRDLLDRMAEVRLAVFGDACLDAYWQISMQRAVLSRETPHYNRPVVGERYSAGALANVAANLRSLGAARVSMFTVLGTDWRGDLLFRVLESLGIDLSPVKRERNRITPAYIKPMLEGYQSEEEGSRIDFVNSCQPSQSTLESMLAELGNKIASFDGVLLGDQVEGGVFTDELITGFTALAEGNANTWITADSRERIAKFRSMVWKPNEMEAAKALALEDEQEPEVLARLLLCSPSRMVYLTCGDSGCYLASDEKVCHYPAYPVSGNIDIVGAGDSFHAAMAAALAAGGSPGEACILGNLAASTTVRKVGTTGMATREEIFGVWKEHKALP